MTVGDTGRVRDRLTTSPVIFGNASVAVAMHVLAATAPLFLTTSKTAAKPPISSGFASDLSGVDHKN